MVRNGTFLGTSRYQETCHSTRTATFQTVSRGSFAIGQTPHRYCNVTATIPISSPKGRLRSIAERLFEAIYALPNSLLKLSEKSLRCPKRVPTRLPNRPVRPFRPRYTGQMHLRSVTRTPFQTVSGRSSQYSTSQHPTKLFRRCRTDPNSGTSVRQSMPED